MGSWRSITNDLEWGACMGTFEYTHFGVGDGLRRWNTWDCDQFGVLIREWCWSTSFFLQSTCVSYLNLCYCQLDFVLAPSAGYNVDVLHSQSAEVTAANMWVFYSNIPLDKSLISFKGHPRNDYLSLNCACITLHRKNRSGRHRRNSSRSRLDFLHVSNFLLWSLSFRSWLALL